MSAPQLWGAQFREVTTDMVSLYGAFADNVRGDFLYHLIVTRGTRVVLSHGSAFAFANATSLKQSHPRLATIDILHNDLPGGRIPSAVVAIESIDAHVETSDRFARTQGGMVCHRIGL